MRKRIYRILDVAADGDALSRWVDIFLVVLIALNISSVILETVSVFKRFDYYFRIFEIFSIAVFSVEYLSRLWSCVEDERFSGGVKGRLRYVFTPMALIDLIAILPFYFSMLFVIDLRFLRIFRLFRALRLLKLSRYSKSLRLLGKVFSSKKEELGIVLLMILSILILSSSFLYYFENESQPEAFSSIPAAMWWGIATLTTVGYGDIYPVTPLGKIFGSLIALLGVCIIALPAGILASGFNEALKNEPKDNICPHCNKKID
jgi:voltage-gated potassium channel